MAGLTPSQARATLATRFPVVVRAGAGSGKTTVLVHRYLQTLEWVRSHTRDLDHALRQVACVTFTTQAADEMRHRASRLATERGLPDNVVHRISSTQWIGTIHSLCFQILKQEGHLIGVPHALERPVLGWEWEALVQQAFEACLSTLPSTSAVFHAEWPPLTLRDFFVAQYERREALAVVAPGSPTELGDFQQAAVVFSSLLERALIERKLFSFSDLENWALRLLNHPQSQLCFDHLLIDEFQDTSPTQWTILERLSAKRPLRKHLEGVFVVGDPYQSIYRFRGSTPELFAELETLAAQSGTLVSLEENFRSAPYILDFVNSFAKDCLTPPLSSNFSGDGNATFSLVAGHTEAEDERRTASPLADLPTSQLVGVVDSPEVVLSTINTWIALGVPLSGIAVLSRTSDALEPIVRALEESTIPVESARTVYLNHSRSFVSLLHYLDLIANPSPFAWARWIGSHGLAFSSLPSHNALEAFLNAHPLYQALKHELEAKSLSENSSVDFAIELLCAFLPGVVSESALSTLAAALPSSQITVGEWCRSASSTAEALWLQTVKPAGVETVKAMTIHAAKGLEFEAVIVLDALRKPVFRQEDPWLFQRGSLFAKSRRSDSAAATSSFTTASSGASSATPSGTPSGASSGAQNLWETNPAFEGALEWEKQSAASESLRLLYVAMTRAKRALTLHIDKDTLKKPLCSLDWLAPFGVSPERPG